MGNSASSILTKQKKTFGIALIIVAIAAMGLIIWFVGVPMVKFASQPDKFRTWVDSSGIWGRVAFAGMVIFQVIIALIPGEPFEIAAGYTFGMLEGTCLLIFASTLGSMAVFMLVRKYGLHLVELFFSKERLDSVKFLKSSPKRDILFFIIFMIPGTPKDLLCYFAGLTNIKLGTWLLICSLGRLPSIITSTVGGDALGTQNYWFAAAVFVVAILISGIGVIVYNKACQKRSR